MRPPPIGWGSFSFKPKYVDCTEDLAVGALIAYIRLLRT